jgi:hypothetical protein
LVIKAAWSRAVGLAAGAAFVAAAAASAAGGPATYAGTTSERGAVTFTVTAAGTSIDAFSASDGYNQKCRFHGGVGGISNFTISIAGMKVGPGGVFTGTTKAKLGPFSATITVKGKLTDAGASGTLNQVGHTCGSGAGNPSMPDYLETFSARRSASG